MTNIRKFTARLAPMVSPARRVSMRFVDHMELLDDMSDPIVGSVFGNHVDYGHLFAYCFRRFGYPNRAWDADRSLASYMLTTPHPDMLLNVTPMVEGYTTVVFRFSVPLELSQAISAYSRRDIVAWSRRAMTWAEERGLPSWLPEHLQSMKQVFAATGRELPEDASWHDIIDFDFPVGTGEIFELTKRSADFRRTVLGAFEKLEPRPLAYERPLDWTTWNDDDPLKPCAAAAIAALSDLQRPVSVRDGAINATGPVKNPKRHVKTAASAGYPAGALGNEHPKEFYELQRLILALGGNNPASGVKKAVRDLRRIVSAAPVMEPEHAPDNHGAPSAGATAAAP